MTETHPLFTPDASRVAETGLAAFLAFARQRGVDAVDTVALHRWSVAEPAAFWSALWDFCGVVGEKGERLLADADKMPGARFFPDARLNYAENLLRRSGDGDSIVFRREDGGRVAWSWDQLHAEVSRWQQAMSSLGLEAGDRVAGYLPNVPEAVAAMLAAASIGAVWSSASPDFGVRGVLDRFGQIAPKLLITVDAYRYAGKPIEQSQKVAEIAAALPSLQRLIVVDHFGGADALAAKATNGMTAADFLAPFAPQPLQFARLPFDHPLLILFSSGTTGAPKCIVHRAGGVMLQHLKEHRLHSDVRPGDRIFYFTTLGWMMWNWLVGGLSAGATLLLFDGSPFHPGPEALFDIARDERMTLFGTSAKYIDALRKSGFIPAATHALPALRTLCSTGSPLAPDNFDFVYQAIKPDLHLASISGGTDIVSCFVLGDPTRPVFRGEIQGRGLAWRWMCSPRMAVRPPSAKRANWSARRRFR